MVLVAAVLGANGCAMILGDDFVIDSDDETNGRTQTSTTNDCDAKDCNGCGLCACSAELNACNASSECVALLDCYSNPCGDGSCPSCGDQADSTTCYQGCDGLHPDGVAPEEAALQCYIDKCPTACG